MAVTSRWVVLCGMIVVLACVGCSNSEPQNAGPNGGAADDSAESPGTAETPEAAEARALQTEKMKTIVKAMHDHVKENTNFPNFNSNGISPAREGRKTGLSWRVYILPYLGEQELYDQFNHDEPWDGPTNKPLIEKIPKVFQSPEVSTVGKTSIHVFVCKADDSPGTPFRDFGEDAEYAGGSKPRDITDGVRSTLLFVLAGPDKADDWTKPTGIRFDANKDSLEQLGNIPTEGFFVAFMDGLVGQIKPTISSEKLRQIIQHNDAEHGDPIQGVPGIERPAAE